MKPEDEESWIAWSSQEKGVGGEEARNGLQMGELWIQWDDQ